MSDKPSLLQRLKGEKVVPTETVIEDAQAKQETTSIPEPAQVNVAPIVASQTTERKEETKRPANAPWKPSSLLTIPEHLKEAGKRYRWVDSGKDGNFQRKLAEGWVVDEELSKKLNKISGSVQDSGNINSTTKVRELIVMWIPEDRAEARNAYYNSKIVDGKQMKQDLVDSTGGLAYGEVTRER